jgi:hypothetical protein
MNFVKPHYRWDTDQGKYLIMSNELTNREGGEIIPAWAKQKSSGASLGNLGAEDIKPPQIKLLQATSPECAEQPEARPGCFWLSGPNINLGQEVIGTPIILNRTYVVWNPTKSLDSKAPLAVASDAVHWDIPDQTFTVYFPNNPSAYTWQTKRTVAESGLDKFGSSRPDDPHSTPAASLTFQILWAFRLPDGRPQLGVITNSKSGIKPARELFAMVEGKGIDHYFQRFRMTAVRIQARPGEYFFGYKFFASGTVQDEAEGDAYRALYEKYRKAGFSTDMGDEAPTTERARSVPVHAAAKDDDEIPF